MNICLCFSDEARIYFTQLTDQSAYVPFNCPDEIIIQ